MKVRACSRVEVRACRAVHGGGQWQHTLAILGKDQYGMLLVEEHWRTGRNRGALTES